MPKSSEYLEYVLEQLDRLGGVIPRRMFGGSGLYQHDVFFGLVFSDTLYFKVNDDNRPEYESRGMRRFQPYKDRPLLSFTYYEVPAEVLEDREELTAWARRSVQAATAIALEKEAKKRKPKARKTKGAKVKSNARRTAGAESAGKRPGTGATRGRVAGEPAGPRNRRPASRAKRGRPTG